MLAFAWKQNQPLRVERNLLVCLFVQIDVHLTAIEAAIVNNVIPANSVEQNTHIICYYWLFYGQDEFLCKVLFVVLLPDR